MNQSLFEAMILGLSGFTLMGVIALKVDLAVIVQRLEGNREKIAKLEANIDELWEAFHSRS